MNSNRKNLNLEAITFKPINVIDVDKILIIENSVHTHPWTKQIMIDCIQSDYQCWMLILNEEILGYGVLSVAVGESHILNISVSASWQRRGLGRKLLSHLLVRARGMDAYVVFLEVRASNKSARKLYYSEGFNEIGKRKGYYPSEKHREDALILSLAL